jgi:hypothetical protein
MRKSTIALYGAALLLIIGAGLGLALRNKPVASTVVTTPTPSASPAVTATPLPSPSGQLYPDTGLGISFRYPDGYYAVEQPAKKEVEISNYRDLAAGTTPPDYRTVGISYDSNSASYESNISGAKGAALTSVPVSGGTVRLYTYQNPSHSDRTLAMAFFSGKYSYSITMGWDAYNSTQDEANREAAEVALIKQVAPTIVLSK